MELFDVSSAFCAVGDQWQHAAHMNGLNWNGESTLVAVPHTQLVAHLVVHTWRYNQAELCGVLGGFRELELNALGCK